MPIPQCLSNRYTDTDSDDEDEPYFDENGCQYRFLPCTKASGAMTLTPRMSSEVHNCAKCGLQFESAGDLHNHMINTDVHFYCSECKLDYKSELELRGHLLQSSRHIVCKNCFKRFKTEEGLETHCSQMHRNKGSFPCPGCQVLFTSVAGITQHIETGGCKTGVTPETFKERINNQNNPLSSLNFPAYMLKGSTTTHTWRTGILPARVRDVIKGDGSAGTLAKDHISVLDYVSPAAEEDALHHGDMQRYWRDIVTSYVCPYRKCNKKFKKTTAIRQHLMSDTHAKKTFRCPACLDCFISSSALIQHAESGTCRFKGSAEYSRVIQNLTGGLVDKEVVDKGTPAKGW